MLEQVPVEAASFAEFTSLAELLAHEEELLTGMTVLIGVKESEIGELLPHVAGHFVEKRIFAVDNFVVRERQHEVLGESVEHREGELVLMVFAMNGVGGEISEGVVHPAHVPLETKTETTEIGRARDTGPSC